MTKITYNTSPYTDDADLPHSPAVTPAPCPGCEAAAKQIQHRERQIASLIEGIDKWESRYITSREHNEKLATDNYRLSVIEQELADLKSDKAQADKLAAERADELSNLRREHDALRAGILRVIEDYPRAIKQDAEEALRALVAGTVAPVSGDSDLRARLAALLSARTPPYVNEIECNAYARGRVDVLKELRALLAETEAKK